ncbi:MAG: hypothetical protein ACLQT7_00685 [Candidatus Dormibacteria bacterium]
MPDQYPAPIPGPPVTPTDPVGADLIVEHLRSVVGALAVIAGLIGALAVHVIFAGTFLALLAPSGADTTQLIAVSDLLGFAFFFALASVAGRPIVGRGRGRRL